MKYKEHAFELVYNVKQGIDITEPDFLYLSIDDKPSYALSLDTAEKLAKMLVEGIKKARSV